MESIRKYKALLVLGLIVLAGIFFFFYRMYQGDMQKLEGFVTAYEKFDTAISDFSISKTADSEKKADDALAELTASSGFRVTSLIKNDSIIPSSTLEVADLSGKELESLKAYAIAIQNKSADVDTLAKEYGDLTANRKAAYDRFEGSSANKI